MGEERQFKFPELNGIKITKEEIEQILNSDTINKTSYDLIDAD